MAQDHEKELKGLMDQITCPKDFECYRQRFSKLCKAGDVGPGGITKCLENRAYECSFATLYNGVFYCTCPIRVYVCKNLEK